MLALSPVVVTVLAAVVFVDVPLDTAVPCAMIVAADGAESAAA